MPLLPSLDSYTAQADAETAAEAAAAELEAEPDAGIDTELGF
jgi:hypothetical protein